MHEPLEIPDEAIDRVRRRIEQELSPRQPLRPSRRHRPYRRKVALTLVTLTLVGVVVAVVAGAGGQSAIASGIDRIDRFLSGGDAPGAVADQATALQFMADFTNVKDGTTRVLATTSDGQQLVALKGTTNDQPYACFDYGHHYGDCSPIGQSDMFAKGPIALLVGTTSRTPGRGTLWALVRDDVARVELRYRDGTTDSALTPHNGMAMLFDPHRHPSELIALSADGRVLGTANRELPLQTQPLGGQPN